MPDALCMSFLCIHQHLLPWMRRYKGIASTSGWKNSLVSARKSGSITVSSLLYPVCFRENSEIPEQTCKTTPKESGVLGDFNRSMDNLGYMPESDSGTDAAYLENNRNI